MKKIIGTLVIIIGLSSTCYSQFTKGKILAGGSFNSAWSNKIGSNSTSYVPGKTFSINLYPQSGYFFANNFAAGIGLNLGTEIIKSSVFLSDSEFKLQTNTLSFEPFARYYFLKKFYTQAIFKAGRTGSYGTDYKKFKGWSLAAGYAYMLNEHVAIEPQIGYSIDYKGNSLNRTNKQDVFLKIGIQVYLGR